MSVSSSAEKVLLPAAAAGVVLAIWHVAVVVSKTKIFPSPASVLRAVAGLAEKRILWSYLADSLLRVGAGFCTAVLLAIPAGVLLGWYPAAARAVNPLIQMLRPISPLAWMPLAVIWFGVSNAAPVFLIALASFFPLLVASMNAVRNVPQVYLRAGTNFGLSTSRLLRSVVLPAILPRILTGLRIAFGVAWLVLVAAEMIAVDSGLGYLIIDARNAGKRYDLVVAGMFLIGGCGLVLDSMIRRAEMRWGFRE